MKQMKVQLWLAVLSLLVLLTLGGAATYAWFTFGTSTNVLPVERTIGSGSGNLLISDAENGVYDIQCTLPLSQTVEKFAPLSTADCKTFYYGIGQTREGITNRFAQAPEADVYKQMFHGTVYLKNEGEDGDAYLNVSEMSFGEDLKAQSALRLALRFNGSAGEEFYMFEVTKAVNGTSRQTIAQAGAVVSSIDGGGGPNFVADPSRPLSDFEARVSGDDEVSVVGKPLYRLKAEEPVSVEFWLWLEGCDDECVNDVQAGNVALQLAFCSASVED